MSDSDAQALPDPPAEAHRDPASGRTYRYSDGNRTLTVTHPDGSTERYRRADGDDAAWVADAYHQYRDARSAARDAYERAVEHAWGQYREYVGRIGAGPDDHLGLPPAAPVQGEPDRPDGVPDSPRRDREVQGPMGQLRQPGVSDRGAVPAGSHPYDRLDPATAHTHAYPTDHDIGSYAVSWYHHDRTRGHDVRAYAHTHRGAFAAFDLRDPGLDPERRDRVLADWWVRHPDDADAE